MQYPGSPVRAGDTRKDVVKALQQQLKAVGIDGALPAPLTVDGGFGPDTEQAVKVFQARSVDAKGAALEVDGVVGPMSWAALFSQPVQPAAPPANPLLAQVIAVARTQVGVREKPLGSNEGPEVDEYLKRVGLNPSGHFAWCAAFVYWCFDEAARKLAPPIANPVPKTAGVHELWRQAGAHGLLRYTPAQAAANPELIRPGMAFFLDAGGGSGHVGLIVGVDGVRLQTIEGNTTDVSGSREGIGVFLRDARRISQVNLGFSDFTHPA